MSNSALGGRKAPQVAMMKRYEAGSGAESSCGLQAKFGMFAMI